MPILSPANTIFYAVGWLLQDNSAASESAPGGKMNARALIRTAALVALFAAATAYAAKVKNVFVVEATVESQCDDCKGIKKAELREITNELRRVAVVNLPRDRFNVMTKETVQAQGSQVLQECVNAECVIAVGSAVGADYLVKGSVNKVGPAFSLSVEMYETKDGNLVGRWPIGSSRGR